MYACFILYLLIGLPCLYMHIVIGKITGLDPYRLTKVMGRAYSGLGLIVILNYIIALCIFLPTMAHSIMYLYSSFTFVLPWSDCDESWALSNCVSIT